MVNDFDDTDDFDAEPCVRTFESVRALFRDAVQDVPLQRTKVDIAAVQSVEKARGSGAPGWLLATCNPHELSAFFDERMARGALNVLCECPSAGRFFDSHVSQSFRVGENWLVGWAALSRTDASASFGFGLRLLEDAAVFVVLATEASVARVLLLPDDALAAPPIVATGRFPSN